MYSYFRLIIFLVSLIMCIRFCISGAEPLYSEADNRHYNIESVDWDSIITQLQDSYVPDSLEEELHRSEDKMAYRALAQWDNLIQTNETAKVEDYGWLLMSCRTHDAAAGYGLTEAVTEYFILHPEELEFFYRIYSRLSEERKKGLLHFIPTIFITLEVSQPQLSYISDREQLLLRMKSIYPSFFVFFARLGINIEVENNQILINGEVFCLD